MTTTINVIGKNEKGLESYKKPWILKRHWIIVFTCTACYIMFLLRYNLSVAIIPILDEKIPNTTERKYPFDNFMVGQILSSYFYGHAIFQLPAGSLSDKYGSKWLLALGTVGSAILSFFAPFFLDLSPLALIICRVLVGSLQATILCSSYTLFAEWLPKEQKPNAITLVNVGFELGGISAFFFTGLICSETDWRYSFYLFSIPAIIWFIPFYFLVSSKPDEDLKLSDYERQLIENERMNEYITQDLTKKNLVKITPKLDFKILFTSGPIWASCIAKAALALGCYIVTTKMPSYLHDVFDLPVSKNGSFTALTCGGVLLSKLLCLKLSKFIIGLNLMTLTNYRKFFESLALLIPALCLFTITIKNDNQTLVVILVFFTMFGKGFVCLGDTPIVSEFAKDLSGSIFGWTNTWACAMGFAAPMICSYFQEKIDDKFQAWNRVFYVTISGYIIGWIVFILFASAELQPWAESKFVEREETKANLKKSAA